MLAEDNVKRLFDVLAELHEAVGARRVALAAITQIATPSNDVAIKARLARLMEHLDVNGHPAAEDWKRAFNELKTDDSAGLP